MTLLAMTFHESYGNMPSNLLRMYSYYNVSPADHDAILANFGCEWNSTVVPWHNVLDFVLANIESGSFRLPIYM